MTSAPFRPIASKLRWGVTIVAAAVVATACSSANSVNVQHNKSGGGAGGYHYKIAMVTHGGAGDSFWSIVKAGGEQAGKDMGDDFTYQSNGDPTQQSQLIDAAVNQKPDGLIVSMANPDALKTAVQRAVAAGIPVVTINSGEAQSKAFGALSHFGSDETVAGQAVGTDLKQAGVKNVVCVVQEAGNVGLEQRCAGVKSTLGGTVTNLQVDNNNLPGAQSLIQAKLQADKSVDGVVTLGAQVASVAEAGHCGCKQYCEAGHVRPERGCGEGRRRRQDPVRGRSATVPPGIHSGGNAHPVQGESECARRRVTGADRA